MYRSTLMSSSLLIVLASLTLGVGVAHGQVSRSGGGESAALAQQLQQLSSERTELQAQNAKLQQQLDAMRKERDALKTAQQALQRRAHLSESAMKQLEENVAASRRSADQTSAQWKAQMQQLVAKFRETVDTLRTVESDRTALKQTLAQRERDLSSCTDHNLALYRLNQEVLTRLDHQTVWSSLAGAEPFTRIKRNQLDNLVEGYKERADAEHVQAPAAQGGAASSSSAGAASTAAPR